MKVAILTLTYSINFHDADDGDCYAGEGCKILSVYQNRLVAERIAHEFNPVLLQAESENTVFPVQKFNKLLKKRFGFTVHDMQDAYCFKLKVEDFDVEDGD